MSLGPLVLAEGPSAADQLQQRRVIRGEQRILALCLLLAAARARLLDSSSAAAFEAAKQIRCLLVKVRCGEGWRKGGRHPAPTSRCSGAAKGRGDSQRRAC